ncbi:uncharacterized protein KY384_003669 [Bacidia gigantensis]|uniref:uncharacterized protein n=1 Tax=Bacidia gigantensis TaxID=2732470 RepID=UPI001D044B12|nr:uncharacterized protein KY384_003669 [Bacidia gigantensis]KAG8532033.1 hypothetical protein KY384_003669 [Bacidia gigantensis]
MVSSRDFSVQVLSDASVLTQYDDPEPDHELGSHEHSKYIEAVTESTFRLKVILHPTFNIHLLKHDDVVRTCFYFDDDNLGWCLDFERSYIDRCRASGQPAYREITQIHMKDLNTGKWLKGDLSFGALLTSKWHTGLEDTETHPDSVSEESNDKQIKPEDIKGLGSIRITIQRINRQATGRYQESRDGHQNRCEELPEKALKGKAVSNIVKYIMARLA